MTWVIGVDEAGYGPNLGPLVQSAVAVRLPADDPAGWETHRPHVRRASEETDSKASVLARGLIELVHAAYANLPADGEPLVVVCDKHGGRHYYVSLVQSAFPDGWVTPERQDADESRYRIAGLGREVTV